MIDGLDTTNLKMNLKELLRRDKLRQKEIKELSIEFNKKLAAKKPMATQKKK